MRSGFSPPSAAALAAGSPAPQAARGTVAVAAMATPMKERRVYGMGSPRRAGGWSGVGAQVRRLTAQTSTPTAATMSTPLDDGLPVGGHQQQVEPVVEGLDQQQAQRGAPDAAAPTHQARAADDHRGDRVELEALAQVGRPGDHPGGEHHPRRAGQHPRDGVDAEQHPAGVDPRDLGGGAVAADGVDPHAVGGAAHQHPESHDAHDHDDDRDRQPEDGGVGDLPVLARQTVDGRPATDDVGRAGAGGQHPEGGDEGGGCPGARPGCR